MDSRFAMPITVWVTSVEMLGLPAGTAACLFDLDGVLTPTAELHDQAWKQMFDDFLRRRGQPPFDRARDYQLYVDGKPRSEGVRSFLGSRGLRLPDGRADDSPSAETLHGLGERKDEIFLELLAEKGVNAYPGSLRYLARVRAAGLRAAVVSSSRNCRQVVEAAQLAQWLDAEIDGVVAAERRLAGKPAPDVYLAAAGALGLPAERCAVFEDALAGVEAGRAGRFGFVVGVDRVGQARALAEHGADRVVRDLSELLGELPAELLEPRG